MKKLTFILLVIIFIASLVSCDKIQESELANCTTDVVSYGYDEFMSIYGQTANADTNTDKANAISDMIIPKLMTNDFYCTKVNVGEQYVDFYYNPLSRPKDSIFLLSEGIYISVEIWEDSYKEITKEEGEDVIKHIEHISDKYAYNEGLNMWYINFNGKCVTIYFPDDIQFTDPERISDYFEFEILNPSNNNTVTQ